LFIRQYLPRVQEESSVANIVKIESVKEISGLVADFCGHMPEVVGFELDVLPVNDFNA